MEEEKNNNEIISTETQTNESFNATSDSPQVVNTVNTGLEMLKRKKNKNNITLYLMLALSVINIPSMIFSDSMFLMSIFASQYALSVPYGSYEKPPLSSFAIPAVIAVAIIAIFAVLILLQKKSILTLYVAAFLFVLDTLFMLYVVISAGLLASFIVNIVLHVLVIYSFFAVITADKKIRRFS